MFAGRRAGRGGRNGGWRAWGVTGARNGGRGRGAVRRAGEGAGAEGAALEARAEVELPLLGAHAAVWGLARGWTLDDLKGAAKSASHFGYDVLELPLFDPESVDARAVRALLEELNGSHEGTILQPTASLGLSFATDISSDSSEVSAAGETLLNGALDVAAGTGAPVLAGVLHSAMAKYPGPAAPGAWHRSVAAIRRLADRAADLGVDIGLEAVNRYESNLVNTAAQCREFCEDVGRPNVMVHLDSYHMHLEEAGFEGAVRAAGSRLGYIHVGESHRGALGTGNVDFRSLFRALTVADYSGPLVYEAFAPAAAGPELAAALSCWRATWSAPDDVAEQANNFMAVEWRAALAARSL